MNYLSLPSIIAIFFLLLSAAVVFFFRRKYFRKDIDDELTDKNDNPKPH